MTREKAHAARAFALALALQGCGGATSGAADPEAPSAPTSTPAAAETSERAEAEPSPQAASPEEPAKSGTSASASPTERLMKEHFKAVNAIRLAVIAGNRDEIWKPS